MMCIFRLYNLVMLAYYKMLMNANKNANIFAVKMTPKLKLIYTHGCSNNIFNNIILLL